MRPELGYNLAGGLLLTVRENDFWNLINGVRSAGYRCACVLPFRALSREGQIHDLTNSPLTIVHFEDAWNPTPYDNFRKAVAAGIKGYLQRFRGDMTQPPILQDALFPGKATCERLFKELMRAFPETKFISHQVSTEYPPSRLLLEIHPGLNLSPQQITDYSQEQGVALVFDPSHLLATEKMISLPSQPTTPSRGEWERQFNTFAYRLEVVDINPPKKEDVADLLKGKGILAELAQAAGEQPNIQFLRVEIPMPPATQIPNSPLQAQGFTFLQKIGEALKAA